MKRQEAGGIADSLLKTTVGLYTRIQLCGSYRRGEPHIGDMDFLVTDCDLSEILECIKDFVPKTVVTRAGENLLSLKMGKVKMEFTAVPDTSWGAGLLHCTGSAQFNTELRTYAKQKGMLLNQYGVYRNGELRTRGSSEEDVFYELGFQWIHPSLRDSFWKRKDSYKLKKMEKIK